MNDNTTEGSQQPNSVLPTSPNGGHVPPPPATPPVSASPEPLQPSTKPEKVRSPYGMMAVFALIAGIIGAVIGVIITAVLVFSVFGMPSSAANRNTPTSPNAGRASAPLTNGDAVDSVAVADTVVPSVVNIAVTSQSQGQMPFGHTPIDTEQSSTGSGVILDLKGHILTNNHVVEGADSLIVTVGSKDYEAHIIGTDPSSDLAVVKINPGNDKLTPISVGDSSTLQVGEWVMAVGSPFGLEKSVSSGIVSALKRSETMEMQTGVSVYSNMIQIDAAINPGNSGGALVDASAQLIGINTLIQSTTNSSAGVGFAIPVNYAMDIAEQLIETGAAVHPYMGVSLGTVDESVAQQYNIKGTTTGAYVVTIVDGSPAQKAGVQEGDVVVDFNGEQIDSADDLMIAIRSNKPGDAVPLTVYRDGAKKTVEVTLGSDESAQRR